MDKFFTVIRGIPMDVQMGEDAMHCLAVTAFRQLVEQRLEWLNLTGQIEETPSEKNVKAAATWVRNNVLDLDE